MKTRPNSSKLQRAINPLIETMEARRMLCASHYDPIANPAPKWDEAIEQDFQTARGSGGSDGDGRAVGIIWANRNTLSGAGDNFFDDVFGTSRAAAQAVVDAALSAWSRVISSFNRADGTSTLQINITMNRDANNNFVGGFGGAGGPDGTAPADGKPRTGSITVNAGNLSPNANDSNGWFLDPTPNDYAEFQGNILTPFAANQTTAIGSDLFSLITAEVTHTLGFISPKPGSNSFSGYRLETSGFAQATTVADNAEGGGNKGFFYTFDGPTIDHLMTGYNSGDTDADSWGNVIHTSGGTGNISWNGKTWRGTEDDGNAIYANERMLPSHVTATILQDAYGYSIEPPAKFGSMYAVLDSSTGIMNIRGAANSNDSISVTRSGSLLTVSVDLQNDVAGSHNISDGTTAPAWTTEFSLAGISQINVFPNSGNDTVLVSADMGTIPVLVSDTLGTDKLQIIGGAGYDSFATPAAPTITTTNGSVSYTSMETLEIFTGDGDADVSLALTNASTARVTGGAGAQTINFSHLASNTPTILDLGNGSDVLNFGTGAGVNPIKSPVTVFAGLGDDVINLAPSDFASTVITQPVTVFGDSGNDTLVLGSNNADSVDVNITFDGGAHAGGNGDRVVINDQAPSYNVSYTIANTVVTRDGFNLPHTISYSNTEGVVVHAGSGADSVNVLNGVTATVTANGNNGNDNFIRGGGNLSGASPALFNGGLGTDRITFDDHLATGNVIFDIKESEVIYGGLLSQFTNGFESVGILAGSGQNEITFVGELSQEFNIDAGGGADTIIFGFNNRADFQNAVTVNGGAGDDSFQWRNGSNTWSNFSTLPPSLPGLGTKPFVLDGGIGFNSLSIDDTVRGTANYTLSDTRLYEVEGDGLVYGRDFAYDNMGTIGVTCSTSPNIVSVTGVSTDIDPGNQVTINMSGGANVAHVYPRNAAGDLTINGNIGILGGTGSDSMTIQDGTSTLPINYSFSNPFGAGTQNVFGLGTQGGLGTAGVENLTVNAGTGNDTFAINQYKSGTGLTLNAGLGDDVCDFGNGDVATNVTSISSFLFNGMEGTDTFNLRNALSASAFTYNAAANTTLQVSRVSPGYFVSLEYYNTDQKVVYAGPAADTMNITNFASGELSFHGAGGNDLLNLPTSPDLLGRRVNFFGDAGTANQINHATNTKTAPTTLHVSQNTIGAFPGDTFFAPGGSISIDSVQILGLRMGGGADTVYLEPNAVASIAIVGGNPTTAPGDTLNLAIANAQNPVINGNAASGNLTSNLKTIGWSGFEHGPNSDAVAPAVADFELNLAGGGRTPPPHSIIASFSEQVSFVTPASLSLTNTTTGQVIPASDIAVSLNFDTATYTFPNYPNGVLPDGAYQAQILASGIADSFGNAMNGNSNIERFIWSAGTSGNDVFRLNRDANASEYRVYLNDNDTPAFVSAASTSVIVLAGGEGDDSFTADYANGNPIPPTAKFYGDSGSDTIGVIGSTSDDVANFYDGTIQLVGAELNHSGMERVTYDTGGGAYDTVALNEIAVTLVGTRNLAHLTINDGATGLVDAGSDSTLITRQLTMAPTALLDLADNDLLIDPNSGTLRGGGNTIGQIQALINSARNGGTWDGFGILSSSARDASPGNTTLGALLGSEYQSVYGPAATFNGEAITPESILVKYTYYGDADFNGQVNFDDYSRIDNGFSTNKTGWLNGDFDGSGAVNFDDYSLIDLAFNTQGGALRGPSAPPTKPGRGTL